MRGSLPIRCISSCECIDRKVRGITLTTNITICLRVIRNAWHFYYALCLVVKVVCRSIGLALLTP
nr:DUF3265 domain-containing protein [Vibrio vulnificus]